MARFAHKDGGHEVWADGMPYPKKSARRPSTAVDPKRVAAGFKLSLLNLLKSGDYTRGEMAKIFKISIPTLYRHIEELQRQMKLANNLTELERKNLLGIELDDDDYEEIERRNMLGIESDDDYGYEDEDEE
jgi:hypothetical protein